MGENTFHIVYRGGGSGMWGAFTPPNLVRASCPRPNSMLISRYFYPLLLECYPHPHPCTWLSMLPLHGLRKSPTALLLLPSWYKRKRPSATRVRASGHFHFRAGGCFVHHSLATMVCLLPARCKHKHYICHLPKRKPRISPGLPL